MKSQVTGIFPIPVYTTERDSDLDPVEKKEIEDIINKEGMRKNNTNYSSIDTNIFDTKLKNLKEFCEQQIKIFVEEVIRPREKFDFYITQSWIIVNKPGDSHDSHYHPNSIISGVFYIKTEESDNVTFTDPNQKVKHQIRLESEASNPTPYYVDGVQFPVSNNLLILFPSWMEHGVSPNPDATTNRICLSFNTFAKGVFGSKGLSNELVLQ